MVCIRDITNEESLEREFNSIRDVFKTLKKEGATLRICWGTRKAMQEAGI